MVTNIFSLPGKEDFTIKRNDVSSSSHSVLPSNHIGLLRQHQAKKIQNYVQFRSAATQRVNNFFQTAFIFIKKQTNIRVPHPGRFYVQEKSNMNNQTNTQEYCRYRHANYQTSNKPNVLYNSYYSPTTKPNENEYSRYRNSHSSREKSITRMETPTRIHHQCRLLKYDAEAQRFQFSDDKVPWNVDFPDYKPTEYTTKKIQQNPKADSIDPTKITKHNQIDGKIDRRSFTGRYYIDPETKRPRNPIGRTGITGRGRLYHWGPNHAGDPVVTRWKRDANGAMIYRRMNALDRLKPVLEFVAIQRHDTKQWALPGGMVDPGENITETVKREFHEEAASEGLDETSVKRLFSNGFKLYESYVDDPRNTDNAWMETVAMHFHDETGQLTSHLNLNAGDDAEKVVWCPIDRTLQLYACHKDFLKAAVDRLDAFW
jgi:ADP-ribose pyrophosphatase